MTWYIWKLWILAWAAGPGKFGHEITESGELWVCLFGQLYVRMQSWPVVIVMFDHKDLEELPTFYSYDHMMQLLGKHLTDRGADLSYGKVTRHVSVNRDQFMLIWEGRK